MNQVIEAAFDVAWQRYEEASARAARIAGEQLDLFDTACLEAREWWGISNACAEGLRHG